MPWEAYIHPNSICLLLFALFCVFLFLGRGWRIGNKVFVVYKCALIEKLLCTQLLFGFCLCFLRLLGWGWSDCRIGYKLSVVYKCIFIEKLLCTQLLFVFCFCFYFVLCVGEGLGLFYHDFVEGSFWGGVEWEDETFHKVFVVCKYTYNMGLQYPLLCNLFVSI